MSTPFKMGKLGYPARRALTAATTILAAGALMIAGVAPVSAAEASNHSVAFENASEENALGVGDGLSPALLAPNRHAQQPLEPAAAAAGKSSLSATDQPESRSLLFDNLVYCLAKQVGVHDAQKLLEKFSVGGLMAYLKKHVPRFLGRFIPIGGWFFAADELDKCLKQRLRDFYHDNRVCGHVPPPCQFARVKPVQAGEALMPIPHGG